MTMPNILDIKDGDRILISRTDRLGDLILALPFVETIKVRYPKCQVDVIASLYASPILENNSRIDNIVRVQNDQLQTNKLYRKDLLGKVRRSDYKVVVVVYPERKISRLFYDAEIPIRLGTAGRFHSILFNHHLVHSRKQNLKHESEYNLDFLQFFREGETVRLPQVYLREKEIKNARRILTNVGVKNKFVVIHPGSGGSAERWHLDDFINLYRLLEQEKLELVISGSEGEGEMIAAASEKLGLPLRRIAGQTDLRTLAAVLSQAELMIANSTGPLHLAVAVGTRTVGLYPSRKAMSPRRWGPLGARDLVIQPEGVECRCPSGQCTCMKMIKAETVAQNVMELLAQ